MPAENLPATHGAQALAPAVEKEPTPQAVHLVDAVAPVVVR